jgi:hypothetical protein
VTQHSVKPLPQIALLAFERVARGDTVDASPPGFVPQPAASISKGYISSLGLTRYGQRIVEFLELPPRAYLDAYKRKALWNPIHPTHTLPDLRNLAPSLIINSNYKACR